MIPAGLCMNCMNGHTQNGVCTNCGARGVTENRVAKALPYGCIVHNRYYVGKVLGAGGFGITYMAWDMQAGCRVALKELYPDNDVYREHDKCTVNIVNGQETYFEHVKKRFLDEARVISGFKDEKEIINIYHLFSANNTAYYSMEFMEGMDLKAYIRSNGPMKWNMLSPIAAAALRQLSILHKRGLIHRDISPDNIFLMKDGSVKLIDFGSVRTYMGDESLTSILKHNFAPIEQYREHGDQRPWTDIYSLSITMYYMLSGVLPQSAPDRVTGDTVRPLNSIVPDVPEYVSRAIMKGMAVMPQDRFTTSEEYLNALGLFQRPRAARYTVFCIMGRFKGVGWTVENNRPLSIGRGERRTITYPPNTGGVSRNHCTLAIDNTGRLCIRDDGSSYGTFLNNVRLRPGEWKYVDEGSIITFAQEGFRVIVET